MLEPIGNYNAIEDISNNEDISNDIITLVPIFFNFIYATLEPIGNYNAIEDISNDIIISVPFFSLFIICSAHCSSILTACDCCSPLVLPFSLPPLDQMQF